MDFFRHSYRMNGDSSIDTPKVELYNQICEFGFLNIKTSEPPTQKEFFTDSTRLYWGKDNLHQSELYGMDAATNGAYSFRNSLNNLYTYCYPLGSISQYRRYSELIFIPLKNGGFFLSNYNNDSFNSTPRLDLSQYNTDSGNPSYLAAIAPTNNSIINNYIYIYRSYQNVRTFDFQKREVFTPNIIDTAAKMTYTDINQNVCTLIKMPYNNYFLDNIYLISTAPATLKNSTFFSFGGRNFFNIEDNIVLELPNN